MTHEIPSTPARRRPYEVFGLTEKEALNSRISQERFQELLLDERTLVHEIKLSSNSYGEFLFVTASRPGQQSRVCMTFYGLGYHEQRERWIDQEWFWYQANQFPELLQRQVDKKDAQKLLQERIEDIRLQNGGETQSERGRLFEILADLTDEDGALAEMEDLDSLDYWLFLIDSQIPLEEPPPSGENLLDQASREKLPKLYHGEDRDVNALAQVKFFTPDSNWTWYASEFDGEDIFFGLVSGFDIEYGNFSLKELQDAIDLLGLQIERDVHFEPKPLKELEEWHRKQREENGGDTWSCWFG